MRSSTGRIVVQQGAIEFRHTTGQTFVLHAAGFALRPRAAREGRGDPLAADRARGSREECVGCHQ
jgi:hypothetical protein